MCGHIGFGLLDKALDAVGMVVAINEGAQQDAVQRRAQCRFGVKRRQRRLHGIGAGQQRLGRGVQLLGKVSDCGQNIGHQVVGEGGEFGVAVM